jgi:NAD(P)-dependent dehydrogenase (short-subunit alcohol dehydrogenase family)
VGGTLSGGATLITGGTSGIGLGVAARLVRDGRPVLVLGRDAERAAEARSRLIADADPELVGMAVGDTQDPAVLARAVEEGRARWGSVGGLVTSAGLLAKGTVLDLPAAELRTALETNVIGTWLALQSVLPQMIEDGYGRIVAIGSVLGTVGAAERAAYAATKGAVAALVRSVAVEVATTGVTVNCVAPGPVRTSMNDAPGTARDQAADAEFSRSVPVGRWGTPADIAHAVVSLLAPEAAWSTGAVVHVDGGYTAR